MTTEPNDGLRYLTDYPKLWKWINRCARCGFLGTQPNLPEQLRSRHSLQRYFPVMPLDADGLCEQCAAHQAQSSG